MSPEDVLLTSFAPQYRALDINGQNQLLLDRDRANDMQQRLLLAERDRNANQQAMAVLAMQHQNALDLANRQSDAALKLHKEVAKIQGENELKKQEAMMDRIMAVNNDKELNAEVEKAKAGNLVKTQAYAKAGEYGFQVNPELDPEENYANALRAIEVGERNENINSIHGAASQAYLDALPVLKAQYLEKAKTDYIKDDPQAMLGLQEYSKFLGASGQPDSPDQRQRFFATSKGKPFRQTLTGYYDALSASAKTADSAARTHALQSVSSLIGHVRPKDWARITGALGKPLGPEPGQPGASNGPTDFMGQLNAMMAQSGGGQADPGAGYGMLQQSQINSGVDPSAVMASPAAAPTAPAVDPAAVTAAPAAAPAAPVAPRDPSLADAEFAKGLTAMMSPNQTNVYGAALRTGLANAIGIPDKQTGGTLGGDALNPWTPVEGFKNMYRDTLGRALGSPHEKGDVLQALLADPKLGPALKEKIAALDPQTVHNIIVNAYGAAQKTPRGYSTDINSKLNPHELNLPDFSMVSPMAGGDSFTPPTSQAPFVSDMVQDRNAKVAYLQQLSATPGAANNGFNQAASAKLTQDIDELNQNIMSLGGQ
jgi:hypothetical protein